MTRNDGDQLHDNELAQAILKRADKVLVQLRKVGQEEGRGEGARSVMGERNSRKVVNPRPERPSICLSPHYILESDCLLWRKMGSLRSAARILSADAIICSCKTITIGAWGGENATWNA